MEIDARQQDAITDEQAQYFRENGLLVVRNVLAPAELQALQEQTQVLIELATEGLALPEFTHPDFFYQTHSPTGQRTPYRIEYVIDKTPAGKCLLAHPFILRSVEKLQGRNFIPTWDAMVYKYPGRGAAIPWHRDAGVANAREELAPIFNVDFYLDPADHTNCLWGILGSHRWPEQQVAETIQQLNTDGFQTDPRCVPILMNPGDVIFHNILVLHGSPAAQSHLRRVIYYEFRPLEIERAVGPHTPEYFPLKQNLLLHCLRHRAASPLAQGETPFVYRPDEPVTPTAIIDTYRYPHQRYWRA